VKAGVLMAGALVLAACAGGGAAGGSAAPEIRAESISPALGVNLAEYTRTPEGLYYKDITVGEGAQAVAASRVSVAYRGLLANGTQVDSSGGLTIRLRQDPIIKGWKIGIPGMKVGGSRILIIPPELGYGFREVGAIPPNSTLVFRVQLLRVL
jgi:FKBP-type peptidyl-prolyl cis-trans isomerase